MGVRSADTSRVRRRGGASVQRATKPASVGVGTSRSSCTRQSLHFVVTLVLQEMARQILLLALLAHAALVSAAEEDSSGMGSGDENRCIRPDPRPKPLGGAVDTAGNLEPRCHLACIERVCTFFVPARTENFQLLSLFYSTDFFARRIEHGGLFCTQMNALFSPYTLTYLDASKSALYLNQSVIKTKQV